MELYQHFRTQLRSLNIYELHRKLINHYVRQSEKHAKFKRDIDVIRENHKFLWLDEEPSSWEEQLAKKYYDRLYKEYCICDLSRYEEGEIALRWQVEAELVTGKGQFICGNKICSEKEGLTTWEVNFGYIEHGEKRNALVKLRLCSSCSEKLNYRHERKKVKRAKKRKHRTKDVKNENDESEPLEKVKEESVDDDETPEETEEKDEDDDETNVWKTANPIVEEKSREDDFEEFIDQLLL